MESKPESEPIVRHRLETLHQLWDKLESTTQEKARLLFDANRSELVDQSLADMKKWLAEQQQQLRGDDDVKDLTSANILLKKHQVSVCACAPSRQREAAVVPPSKHTKWIRFEPDLPRPPRPLTP